MRYLLSCLVLVGLCVPLEAIERNVASQKLELMVIDRTTGGPKTGDAANLTAYVSIDGDTTPDALTDTSATELSSTNAPGVYVFDLTQAETNGKSIAYTGKSSTANTDVIPAFVTTVPPNFGIVVIGADGLPTVNVGEWLDTAVATPTTAGVPEVDVTHWLGTAPATPTTAGVPEVDITHWLGTLLTTQPMTASDVQDEAEDGSALAIATYFGTAGSGLTGIPWNAAWDAEVQSEATDAISANFALAGGVVQANTVQISGDGPAADNAEAMFDGTGYAGGTIKLGTNVTQWTGTNVASPDTAGYPKVTIKSGTGTGELNITSGLLAWNSAWDAEAQSEAQDAITASFQLAGGVVEANMVQLSSDEPAAANLEAFIENYSTTGAFPPLGIIDQGTAQAATATTLQLRSAAAFGDNTLIGAFVTITGGSTGVGQTKQILSNVGSTDTVTIEGWPVTPTGTITYVVRGFGFSPTNAAGIRAAIGQNTANFDAITGAISDDAADAKTAAEAAQAKLPSGGQNIAGATDLATVSTRVTTALPNAAPGADAGLPTTADVEAGGGTGQVTADRVAKQVTFYVGSEGNTSRNIVTLNDWSSGTRTLGYDFSELLKQADTQINQVDSVTVVQADGSPSITTSNLRKHQNGMVAMWDTAAISSANAGTYVVTVTIETVDSNTIVVTGTLEVE